MNNDRHSAIFQVPPTASVSIIGAGGLGATTALTLAKMGFKYICLFDGDVVAEENTGTQLHKPSDIGRPKAEALYDTLMDFADDVYVTPICDRVNAATELTGGIIVSCVDSIKARQEIWSAVLQSSADWYLELRMAAEEFQVHTINLNADCDWYDKYIMSQDDKSIPEIACTMKATFFCAMGAAGFAGSIVRKILSGIEPKKKTMMNFFTGVYMEF